MKRWAYPFVLLLAGVLLGSQVYVATTRGQATGEQAAPGRALAKELYSYRHLVKKILPAVVSIDPQFGLFGNGCIHTRSPVSTCHACTSPKCVALGATDPPPPLVPVNARPGVYVTGTPSMAPHRLLLAGT